MVRDKDFSSILIVSCKTNLALELPEEQHNSKILRTICRRLAFVSNSIWMTFGFGKHFWCFKDTSSKNKWALELSSPAVNSSEIAQEKK